MVRSRGIVLLALLLGACSSSQPPAGGLVPHTDQSGFLADYTALQEGKAGEPAYVFRAPAADFSIYDSVVLDAVTLWRGDESVGGTASEEEVQLVADYFYTLLYMRLDRDYEMVTDPGPYSMRVRVAIRKVGEKNMVLQATSSPVPRPNLIPRFQSMADEPVSFRGGASVEVIVSDATTGSMLLAAIERRDANAEGGHSSWRDVERGLKFDSERIGYRLCLERGKRECVQPRADRME